MREPSGSRGRKPFLYVVVCAAGVARDADVLFAAAQDAGWDVGVVATPQGLGFLDAAAVEARTGYPVRSAWRSPGEPRPFPDPDAIAVAPATFNTVNKWAAGIADTLALGILCEAYGQGVPHRRPPRRELLPRPAPRVRRESGQAARHGRTGQLRHAAHAQVR